MRGRASLAIAAILLLSGCGAPKKEPVPVVPKNAAAGQITKHDCAYRKGDVEFPARCGFIFVPENRSKAGSRLIAVPFVQILSQAKKPGEPLFALNGGPGQSNMRFALPVSWFAGRRDIVLVGYRGVDGTVRLDCPEVDSVFRRGGELFGKQSVAGMRQAFRDCAARHTSAGVDLSGYTLTEVVDDFDAVRSALGYGRIHLNAISYGTRLALIYTWHYPQNVARSAMLNVNPPGRFWLDPALLDKQVRRYAELCAADAYCSSRTKDLAADMRRVLDTMPKRWLGLPVSRDVVLLSTYLALYSTDGAATAFDMWIAAANGDYSGTALLTAAYGMMLPQDMGWGDAAAKGGTDFDDPLATCSDLNPDRTLLGSPLSIIACAGAGGWPVQKIPAEYRRVRPSDVETLMVSGTLDVADPAENARNALLPVMKNARQVTLAEFSHFNDIAYFQPDATQRLLTTFHETGRADASAFRYRPVNFDPGWMSLPFIAKTIVAAGALLLSAAIALAFWLIGRRRRRAARQPAG